MYQTNFMRVNTNTWLTTNLFALLGDMLEIPTNSFLPEDSETSYREAYDAWVTNFLWMETDLSALPTNLNLSFPGLFELFDGTTVQPGISSLRDEVYAILADLGFESYVAYGEVPGTYYPVSRTSYANPTNLQLFTVPTGLVEGATITVHAWGGGGRLADTRGHAGGYSSGDLVVVSPTNFVDANASHVTNGMKLVVQVGSVGTRAAVWRYGSYSNFHTMTNELLVAGGAGSRHDAAPGGGPVQTGGVSTNFGGGTYFSNYGGGTYTDPAEDGNGHRVWGARMGCKYEAGGSSGPGWYPANLPGGDGYYGGGAGRWVGWGGGDGGPGWGGSGYVAASLTNGYTETGAETGPGGQAEPSYDGLAGKVNNEGRVTFSIPFVVTH